MICICDYRTPCDVLVSMKERGFQVIQLPPDPSLPEAVNGHADLLVFILDRYLITRRNYYSVAKREIELICSNARLDLILSDEKAGDKYPDDCSLCAVISEKSLICREKSTDKSLLELARDLGYSIVNVPQGYAKCSCVLLPDGAIITADQGIIRAAQIDSLLVCLGHVDLPGYDHGFIGGASGLCGNTLYFCGNIDLHPDCERIKHFARSHGAEVVSLSDNTLYDVGSLIFI